MLDKIQFVEVLEFMTKRNKVSILILLVYSVPYVYLGMYGDKNFRNLLLYGLMIVAMVGLSRYCKRTKRIHVVLIGNILSFLNSYLLTLYLSTDNWDSYFKAFPPTIRTIDFSLIMVVLQMIVLIVTKKDKISIM